MLTYSSIFHSIASLWLASTRVWCAQLQQQPAGIKVLQLQLNCCIQQAALISSPYSAPPPYKQTWWGATMTESWMTPRKGHGGEGVVSPTLYFCSSRDDLIIVFRRTLCIKNTGPTTQIWTHKLLQVSSFILHILWPEWIVLRVRTLVKVLWIWRGLAKVLANYSLWRGSC